MIHVSILSGFADYSLQVDVAHLAKEVLAALLDVIDVQNPFMRSPQAALQQALPLP